MKNNDCLKTKFIIPELKKELLLKRYDLEKKILNSIDSKLIYITAPAGFGKTSFLYQIIETVYKDKKIYWISLDKTDCLLQNLMSCVIDTYQRVFSEDLSLLKYTTEEEINSTLNYFINRSLDIKEDIYIFIDDFHIIGKKDKIFNFLIDKSPKNIHFIISGRNNNIQKLSILRVKNEIQELNLLDLRFNKEEIRKLFILNNITLNNDELDLIYNKTEGWILSIKLAIQFIKKEGTLNNIELIRNKYIVEYFLDDVLKDLNPDIKKFIIYNSIYSKFNYDLSNNLLEISNSQHIINYLEDKNLFLINLDHVGEWYRFHHLISEILITKLKKESPQEYSMLCKKASKILMYESLYSESLNIGFMSGDIIFLSSILQDIAPHILLDEEKNIEWSKYINKLPENILINNTKLLLFYLISIILQSKFDLYNELIIKLNYSKLKDKELIALYKLCELMNLFKNDSNKLKIRQKVSSLSKYTNFIKKDIQPILFLELAIGSFFIMDFDRFNFFIDKALYLTSESQKNIMTINKLSFSSLILILQNEYIKAEVLLKDVLYDIKNSEQIKSEFIYTIYYNLTLIYLTWNRIDDSKNTLDEYRSIVLRYGNNSQKFDFYYIYFTYCLSLKLFDEAENILDTIKKFDDFSLIKELAYSLEINLFIEKKELNKVPEMYIYKLKNIINENLSVKSNSLSVVKSNLINTYLFILVDYYFEKKDYRESLKLLNLSLKYFEDNITIFKSLLPKVYLNLSIVLDKLNMKSDSLLYIKKSLFLSEKSDSIRIYINKKEQIKNLISQVCKDVEKNKDGFDLKLSFPHKILRIINENNVSKKAKTMAKIIDPLSNKEKEILIFISKNLKQKDIANNLNISTNTVKTHLKRIYNKLNVSSKIDAINKAKKWGII